MPIYEHQDITLHIGDNINPQTANYIPLDGLQVNNFLIEAALYDSNHAASGIWASTLNEAGIQQLTISAQGLFSSSDGEIALQQYALANAQFPLRCHFGNGDILEAQMHASSFARTQPLNAPEEFRMTLQSTGLVTYT